MSIALIFPGQGAQSVGMGKTLVEQSTAAKACFDKANELLPFDLKSACFSGPDTLLTETRVCQPALYVHGVAVVEALKAEGQLPEVLCASGLSLGELTALHVAGVFDFETGLQVVAERGRLMQACCEATEGAMASLIGGTPEAARELAQQHDVDLGNDNCPGQIVLSGSTDGIAAAVAAAKAAGFKMAVPLKVAGAYHSRLMQPAADQFQAFLETIPFQAPHIPVFTNVTGKAVSEPQEIKQMLVEQVTSTVRWTDCFSAVTQTEAQAAYECGPGTVLAGLAKRIDRDFPVKSFAAL